MNNLLIEIAKRLVCKAIKINTDEYCIQVAYNFINNKGAIIVTIFNKHFDNQSYFFYDDDEIYSNIHHLREFRYILRKLERVNYEKKSIKTNSKN